jgi:hypothetical protein
LYAAVNHTLLNDCTLNIEHLDPVQDEPDHARVKGEERGGSIIGGPHAHVKGEKRGGSIIGGPHVFKL